MRSSIPGEASRKSSRWAVGIAQPKAHSSPPTTSFFPHVFLFVDHLACNLCPQCDTRVPFALCPLPRARWVSGLKCPPFFVLSSSRAHPFPMAEATRRQRERKRRKLHTSGASSPIFSVFRDVSRDRSSGPSSPATSVSSLPPTTFDIIPTPPVPPTESPAPSTLGVEDLFYQVSVALSEAQSQLPSAEGTPAPDDQSDEAPDDANTYDAEIDEANFAILEVSCHHLSE